MGRAGGAAKNFRGSLPEEAEGTNCSPNGGEKAWPLNFYQKPGTSAMISIRNPQ
jgi:hypothetical protein